MSSSRNFTPKTKREAFKAQLGRCQKCGIKLTTGNVIYDHVIPWEISHDSSLGNCQALCRKSCDYQKTYTEDIPTIAKVHRIHDRAIGIERSGKKLPAGRDSDFKKTIRGGVVPRIRERGARDRAVIERRRIGGIE